MSYGAFREYEAITVIVISGVLHAFSDIFPSELPLAVAWVSWQLCSRQSWHSDTSMTPQSLVYHGVSEVVQSL